MADKCDIARSFVQSVAAGAPDASLLRDDAAFRALNVHVPGRESVLKRMTDEATGKVYKQVSWADPAPDGAAAVQIKGTMPAGSPSGGVILTLQFDGDKIAEVQQQAIPGTPRAPGEMKLTPTIKGFIDNALKTRHPMLVAYTDETGQPVVSFRGSTQAFSDDQLAIWVRNASGSFLSAIKKNPKVALMYRDEDSKATYQFQGRAHIAEDEAARRQVYETMAQVERDHDFARTGVALIIDLDLVQGYAGLSPNGPIEPVRMARSR